MELLVDIKNICKGFCGLKKTKDKSVDDIPKATDVHKSMTVTAKHKAAIFNSKPKMWKIIYTFVTQNIKLFSIVAIKYTVHVYNEQL